MIKIYKRKKNCINKHISLTSKVIKQNALNMYNYSSPKSKVKIINKNDFLLNYKSKLLNYTSLLYLLKITIIAL